MANGEINTIHPPALDSCDFYRNIECSYSFVAPLGFPAADQDAKESQTNALSALCCESLSSCTLLGRRCVPFWAEVSWFKKSPGLSTLQFRWTNIMYNSMTNPILYLLSGFYGHVILLSLRLCECLQCVTNPCLYVYKYKSLIYSSGLSDGYLDQTCVHFTLSGVNLGLLPQSAYLLYAYMPKIK